MNTNNTSTIQLLSSLLQNQIAAGEVVERPSAVLKELVENSLDAGATLIDVTLEDGGQRLLTVTDNGKGMTAEELPLALTRYATSKIASFSDLLHVASYGFRGEALPSIASVACVAIQSCPKGASQGTFINVRYGRIEETGPVIRAEGTTVQIADLFMNVPARLKFLKTPATELKRCQDILLRLALARPDVGFSLSSNGKEIFTFPQNTSLAHRLAAVWPQGITEHLLPVHHTRNDITVKGLVSHPQNSQTRADRLFFYVNNRPIQDKLLISAVREAYKGRLISREYPQAVIFITIDPQEIDVNVHPAKTEIRFRDERTLFSSVHRAITVALQEIEENLFSQHPENTVPLTPHGLPKNQPTMTPLPPLYSESQPHGFWGQADTQRIVHLPETRSTETTEMIEHAGFHEAPNQHSFTPDITNAIGTPQEHIPQVQLQPHSADYSMLPFTSSTYNTFTNPTLAESTSYFSTTTHSKFSTYSCEQTTEHEKNLKENPVGTGALTYLGQLDKTYLIVIHNNDLLILDQHAAHEQILIESFARDREKIGSQLLALPEQYTLHPEEAEQFKKLLPKLQHLGFSFTHITEDSTTLIGIPERLPHADARKLFKDMLIDKQEGMDNTFHMLACRAAIKAGDILTTDEAIGLLEKWATLGAPYYCPHGRPIVLRYTTATLEKLFKRTNS